MARPTPLRLALLTPFSGEAGLWTPSAIASAALAAGERNAGGGILGRPLDLMVRDVGADAAAAAAAARGALCDGAEALVVMAPSYARPAIAAAVRDRAPFVYTPTFEGSGAGERAISVGETTADLLAPALHWLSEEKEARRFFLIGNDYNWPRRSFAVARPLIRRFGGAVVGEALLPFGEKDYGPLMARLSAARPDVAVLYTVGQETVDLNRAMVEHGLDRRMTRFSSAADETILLALGPDATENLYIAAGYLSAARDRANQNFLERYHGAYGENPPPPNAFGQSTYEGVHALAALADAAGGLGAAALRRRVGRTGKARTARAGRDGLICGKPTVHLARVEGIEAKVFASF
jgi:ABC-type branched-subunit amino acid transport system substrate-binding protein